MSDSISRETQKTLKKIRIGLLREVIRYTNLAIITEGKESERYHDMADHLQKVLECSYRRGEKRIDKMDLELE